MGHIVNPYFHSKLAVQSYLKEVKESFQAEWKIFRGGNCQNYFCLLSEERICSISKEITPTILSWANTKLFLLVEFQYFISYVQFVTTAAMTFFVYVLISVFFQENKAWHFIQIVCLADDSHEMSSYFLGKIIWMLSATILLSHWRVNNKTSYCHLAFLVYLQAVTISPSISPC